MLADFGKSPSHWKGNFGSSKNVKDGWMFLESGEAEAA